MSLTFSLLTTPTQLAVWDAWVTQHPEGTFLQATAWGRVKASDGWEARVYGVFAGDQLVAGVQVLIRPLPLGQTLAYLPYGPLWDTTQPQVVSQLLTELAKALDRMMVIKLELHQAAAVDGVQTETGLVQTLQEAGYCVVRHALQPQHTLLLDLSLTEEALLAQMRQTTRRYIRQAERIGLTVEETRDPRQLVEFYGVLDGVHERKHFGIHPLSYYQHIFAAFGEQAHLLFVRQEATLLGAYFLLHQGDKAWELYGGITSAGQPLRANYLLKWRSIQTMRSLGVRWYDQWGVAPLLGSPSPTTAEPVLDEQHPLAGVTYFKQGFGGQRVARFGGFNRPVKPILYRLAHLSGKL